VVKLLLGTKLGMTQVFDDSGAVTPVTVLEVGPCRVVQVMSEERDGHRAAQIGYLPQKAKRVRKPQLGHFKKAGVEPYRFLRESPLSGAGDELPEVGDQITVDQVFAAGVIVDVVGVSKGRGFAGTVKRHGFSRGPEAHGSKNVREPGSTGAHTYPGRVFKGKKMPGHMGARRTTVKNLEVVRVDAEKNRLLLKGAVPGAVGGLVCVSVAKTPPPPKKIQEKKG
jgi:large subunit ribosomal protein L3